MEPTQYCAFISYRHQSPDQEIAKALHTAIETYGIPAAVKKQTGRKTMGKVFRDQEELPLSANLGADIETALDNSEWFIAICSPRYLESRWCLREMEYFIARKGLDRVLTVLAEGEPNDSFPNMVRFVPNPDGTFTELEPLAANVRGATFAESKKKLKTEKLRLLAPMLGLSFDDLNRRARQRRLRIALTSAAIGLAAAAGLAAILVTNHIRSERLKQEAAEQAALAEAQAELAEQQRLLAEEEQRRAEEEQRRAEEERKAKVFNDLGERMERASSALTAGERREAAKILTDALSVSDENEGMRRDDILALMRRTMYIDPFTIVSSFNNQNRQILDLELSPDGTRAVGVVNNNSIAMVDVVQNEVLYTVSVDNTQLIYPHFSQDGSRFFAEGDYGRFVQVWNTADGSEAFRYVSKKNAQYEIDNACFWKDADTLLIQDWDRFWIVGTDGSERLFYTCGDQMPDYDPTYNLLTRLTGRQLDELFTNVTEGYSLQMIVSEDRERVVLSDMAGEFGVIVLDGEGKRVFMPAIPNDPDCKAAGTMADKWALSPDGKTLCCISYYQYIAGWDMDSGELIFIDSIEGDQRTLPAAPVYTADSARMAYTYGPVRYVADARTNALIMTANIDDTNYVPRIAFTADGKYMLLSNESMFIINAETWALELIVEAPAGTPYGVIVPTNNMFLCSRYDGIIYFYSMPSLSNSYVADGFAGELLDGYEPQRAADCVTLFSEHELSATFLTANAYKDYPSRLCFSRDGSIAAIVHPDGAIELFDAQGDGKVKEMIGQLYSYINAIAITEDRLIAMDVDTRMLVYNLNTHTVETITKDGTLYASFEFNADASLMMALCAGLSRIDVFDLNDGCRLLFSIHVPAELGGDTFTDMRFSKDGAYAVGMTASGKCVIGDLFADADALIARTRAFAAGK